MSEPQKIVIKQSSDWAEWLFLLVIIALVAGEPDLLDAITKRVGGCATEAQTLGGESAAPSDDTRDTKSEGK